VMEWPTLALAIPKAAGVLERTIISPCTFRTEMVS